MAEGIDVHQRFRGFSADRLLPLLGLALAGALASCASVERPEYSTSILGLGEEPIAPIQIHTPMDRADRMHLASLPKAEALLLDLLEQASASPFLLGSNPNEVEPVGSRGVRGLQSRGSAAQ